MQLSNISSFIRQHRTETVCFVIFILLALTGFIFHEPGYDESQAWQIAKTASVDEILFTIPHLEGHPPFWHLMLSLPAKLGIHWHWALSIVGMLFMLANGFLLFFRAPFPRWVRCLLPFNYFLFYQYGIIVRPYSAILLIVLLLAIYFPQKDKRPGLFIGLLAALCACHLFGIAIAGGITMAWLWDIKGNYPWKEYLQRLYKDKRFHLMLGLLVWALLLLSSLRQIDGFLMTYLANTASVLQQVIYIFVALPAETVLTDLNNHVHTMRILFPWSGLITTAIVGLLLWTCVLIFLPRKKLLYLLLPYLLVGLIMLNYNSCHHEGVILILFIWYCWITLAEQPLQIKLPAIIRQLAKALLILVLIFPMGWSAYIYYWDYKLVTFPGKDMVNFLNNHNLMDEVIFSEWKILPTDKETVFALNPNLQPSAVMLNMYTDHNIFANFHDGQNITYLDNTCPSEQEIQQIFQRWRNMGMPTVLLGSAAISHLYADSSLLKEYRAAYLGGFYQLWKFTSPKPFSLNIYLHRSLWEKFIHKFPDFNNIPAVKSSTNQDR